VQITAGTLMSLLTSVVCAIELSLAAAAAVAMEQYVAFCKDFSTPAEPIRNSCLKCRLWMTTLAPHVATDICSKVRLLLSADDTFFHMLASHRLELEREAPLHLFAVDFYFLFICFCPLENCDIDVAY